MIQDLPDWTEYLTPAVWEQIQIWSGPIAAFLAVFALCCLIFAAEVWSEE